LQSPSLCCLTSSLAYSPESFYVLNSLISSQPLQCPCFAFVCIHISAENLRQMRSSWLSIVLAAAALFSPSVISNAFQVTGATSGFDPTSKARPVRQGINDFIGSRPAWDLYILALQRFQNASFTDPLSYFQVASIHGNPKGPWDGVNGTGPGDGFCMHQSVLFPLWHRPYLALYEVSGRKPFEGNS